METWTNVINVPFPFFRALPTTGLKRSVFKPNFQDTRVRKIVKTKGFVDIAKNFYVPLEVLESTRELEEAIDENVLAMGFFRGLCDLLSLNLCENIIDFDKKIGEKYGEEMIVIMIDEFDQFLLNIHHQNDTVYQIDKLRELIKLVSDRDTKGIKSIIFAGSFGMITMLENGDLKIKNRNLDFSEKVVDDIYSCTNGYAGLEGLFASLCIEYASNKVVLDFKLFLQRGSLPSSEFNDSLILPKITVINSPQDFLTKVLDFLKHICHDVIFDLLVTNQHSFSKAVIQGELYTLLHAAILYLLFKVFCETKTLRKSEIRCDI
ncbi:unnamed protein product [Rhizophagus irregularis]|nr:unnamed protein product [Rhizophagus irregularis]